jgi:hypothetical protein
MPIDSLGSVSDRHNNTVAADDRIGVQLAFNAPECVVATCATKTIPRVMIEEHDFAASMVMHLRSVAQEAVQNWH